MKPAHLRSARWLLAHGILAAVLTLGTMPVHVTADPSRSPLPQKPDFSGTWHLDPAASEIVAEEVLVYEAATGGSRRRAPLVGAFPGR